jgi:hypothetical protein
MTSFYPTTVGPHQADRKPNCNQKLHQVSCITEMNRIRLVLFGMNYRMF